MRAAQRKAPRGGAMVELALLMIVLVPLLLYSIFLMDVPHMKLESQETTISTIWDYTARNSNPSAGDQEDAWRVTKINSFVWADHTSAFDDGADPTKGTYRDGPALHGEPHPQHHTGFGAQYAFNYSGDPIDSQLSCNLGNRDDQSTFNNDGTWSDDLAWASNPAFQAFASGSMAPGGLGHCFHTAYIYNYAVPQKFLQEFARVDMTRMKFRKGDAHNWQGDISQVYNIPAFGEAGVAFNTWALRNGATDGDIDNADLRQPPSSNPFMKALDEANSSGPFAATWTAATAAEGVWALRALNQRLLAIPATGPVSGLPDPVALYLTARYQKNNPGSGRETNGFESTPFDNVNRTYERAYRDRGPYYMGCQNPERYPCR